MFLTIQYMVFESAWKSSAEEQGLKNLKLPREDPHYGAGVSQLLGLTPVEDIRLQARLHP